MLCLQQHNLCSEVKTHLFETTAHCDKSPATQHPTRASSSFGFKCFGLGHQIETLCKFRSLSMATYSICLFPCSQLTNQQPYLLPALPRRAFQSWLKPFAELLGQLCGCCFDCHLFWSGEPWQSGCQPFFSLWIWCGPPLSSFRISFSLLGRHWIFSM